MNEAKAVDYSRRCFLKRGGSLLALAVPARSAWAANSQDPLFVGYPIPPRKGVQEAVLASAGDGVYWLLFGEQHRLVRKISMDRGRTWGETRAVLETGGNPIETGRDNVHLSLLPLKSGKLGIVYGGPYSRQGRDGTLLYRSSADGGATWSRAVTIDPVFSLCRTAGARVLASGRIVVPTFAWFSPFAGGESEGEDASISVSWVFYSDDEGKSWKRSLSELFVSLDEGRMGCYSFEEPSLVELSDGRLLMFGRTELGRFYQSFSKDGGISWTVPQPVALAASYTPPMLVRIPSTGHVLLIWNQASGEEILAGLSRHRLSTAISEDNGVSWGHFRNLESLDDTPRLNPPPSTPQVYRMVDYFYGEPVNRERYRHAPGCLRICYPTVVFGENEVAITYDYGHGVGEFQNASATKIQILSLNELYAK